MPPKNRLTFALPVLGAVALAAMLTLQGCKKKPAEQALTQTATDSRSETAPAAPPAENTGTKTSPSLRNVIRAARTWQPAFSPLYGQKAPEFTLTDISGKRHKLSDYKGKNVMIIFWATWCGPCKKELPHLIALRNVVGEDKLAMLAISYISSLPPETTEKVKAFVEQNKVNYTVFSVDPGVMPSPYNLVTTIPSSFFIDPQGNIKLITAGLLSLGDMKAILQAEWP